VQNRDAMIENFAIRDRAMIADLRAQNEQLRAALEEMLFHNPQSPAAAVARHVLGLK
jgi:hypothetical protein